MGLSERRCVAAVLLALTLPAQGARFVSQTWQIELRPRCPEGEVSCEIVAVLATDRSSGRVYRTTGRTVHATCAAGVSPCRFLGHAFALGDRDYLLLESGDLVTRDALGNALETSRGAWFDD
ncbi:MAG: hypothetical protein KDH20_17795 [Rhodocyclaceae bacterium]|nr:hypothetical protein [Rhodocyclaceae bacterium]